MGMLCRVETRKKRRCKQHEKSGDGDEGHISQHHVPFFPAKKCKEQKKSEADSNEGNEYGERRSPGIFFQKTDALVGACPSKAWNVERAIDQEFSEQPKDICRMFGMKFDHAGDAFALLVRHAE